MNITFGKTSDDRRKVNKNITGVKEFTNAELKRPTDLLNPVILIKEFNNWDKINYCYITKLDRYYFVDNIVLGLGGILEIHCSIDVLETYKSAIKNLTCLIIRQEGTNKNNINKFIVDNNYPTSAKRNERTVTIGNLGNTHNFFLTTNGGVHN